MGLFYFRVFRYDDKFFAIAKNKNKDSMIYVNDIWGGEFKSLFTFLPNSRHSAVLLDGNILNIFYTIIGQSPESIYVCKIKLDSDVDNWEVLSNQKLTKPMFKWEGAGSDLIPSMPGSATARWGNRNLNELRDPCIFSEDGVDYLLYTFNGEGGIAIGSLNKND